MSFLNPALLWFAAGGAIPVIIHLLHRQRYRKVRWAAMEFLLRALRKTQRRIRLENLILLLIRILLMIVLALAIAKPILESNIVGGGDELTHTFIVIDNSYSMSYQSGQTSLFKKAQKFAKEGIIDERLRQFSQADRISVISMSEYPQEITPGGRNDKQKIKEAIDSIEPSDYGTSMLQTARLLARVIQDPQWKPHVKKIYVLTDMQRIAWLPPTEDERTELAGLLKTIADHPNTHVFLADLGDDGADNTAAVELKMSDPVAVVGRPVTLTAELHNYGADDLPNVSVTLSVGAGLEDPVEKDTQQIFLPAGGNATVQFRHRFVEPGPVRVKVELETDKIHNARGVDNARFLAFDVRTGLRVLCVDGEPDDDGAGPKRDEPYYYQKALDPFGSGTFFQITTKLDTFFDGEELNDFDLLVLANVPALQPEVLKRVEDFVARGGGLLIALGGRVDAPSYNRDFWRDGEGLLPAKLLDVEGTADRGPSASVYHVSTVDVGHDIYDRYNDAMFTALRSVTFNQFLRASDFDPHGVLAGLNDPNASPLLLEKRYGDADRAGKVILYTSTLDHDWAEGFMGENMYVILMMEMSRYLAARPASDRNVFIGDTIAMRLPASLFGDFYVRQPDGREPQPSRSDFQPGDATFWIYHPSAPVKEVPGGEKDPTAESKIELPSTNEGLRHAGFYTLVRQGRSDAGTPVHEPIATFAVNVPPRSPRPGSIAASESNPDRIVYDPGLAAPIREYPDFLARVITEQGAGGGTVAYKAEGSGFWRHLIVAMLVLAAFESLLALFFGLRKR